MKLTKILYTTLATVLLVTASAASANAQTLETVRVRLPNGQLLSLDSDNWQRDRRVVEYHRYYYEPRERTYVVYNEYHRPYYRPEPSRWCPPGQAKKGRC